ncbi:hypothetical protein D3C86_1334860 [compost metagenome]
MRGGRAALHKCLDLVGDMGDDLHGLAQVLAPAFLADHRFIDLAGREVVRFPHLGGNEALIVPQVEVGFRAIFGHEHLAVLEGAHRAGIDVDVGIELEEGDFEAARLENGRERSSSDALAERRDDATGDEDEFGHKPSLPGKSGLYMSGRPARPRKL